MTLIIEVASIAYAGGDIGNDIRASFTVNGAVSQQNLTLSPGGTWRPVSPWEILNTTAAPAAVGSTQDVDITITELDAFSNDVGRGTFTFTAPQHSFVEDTFTQVISVGESNPLSFLGSSAAAAFTVTFKIKCIHALFDTLWQNHPTTRGNRNPCQTGGTPNFENQCAIRMGLTLSRSGISLASFDGAFCWHGHGRDHVLRVEELIAWLQRQNTTLGTPTTHRAVTDANFANQVGLAAFINFWGTGNQGDHIDLWDGTIVRQGDPGYFGRSERVVFWQL